MITRRTILRAAGALPLASLVGCGDDAASTVDASGGVDAVQGDSCGPAAAAWASGGTAAMVNKQCYPDPFASGIGACPLVVCATTAGPCTAPAPARVDVSEGRPGLPVRLSLLLVTADTCAPIANAVVEIWHTQVSGVYSGQTPSPGFCSGGDADAPNHSYFRGTQTTDARGRVDFDTCFPGWYPGRAMHIHFSVAIGGELFLVSQLFFAQPLIQEICATHVDYVDRGQPDTSNDRDGVIGGAASFDAYVLDVARMSDGAMLASKAIAIRGSLATANCSA